MEKAEKRRLKKLGKKLVEQQSRELDERLREANPAPVGSDEWARNYRAGVERERQLRADPAGRVPAADVRKGFVLLTVAEEGPCGLARLPTWYYECPACGDVLHSVPRRPVKCGCGE